MEVVFAVIVIIGLVVFAISGAVYLIMGFAYGYWWLSILMTAVLCVLMIIGIVTGFIGSVKNAVKAIKAVKAEKE